MRKILIIIGVVAGIVLIGAAIAWALIDVNSYRGVIEAQLEQQLKREVTLGNMNLRIFPLRFQVETPVIGEDPRYGKDVPFLRAERLGVFISLLPLLRGNIDIGSIDLQRPNVELIKNKDGVWNFSSLAAAGAPEPTPGEPGGTEGRQLSLRKLAITDGQVAVTDLQRGQPRAVYDHIDISLADYTAGQPFSFTIQVHLPGQGSQELRLEGKGGPVPETNPASAPFDATLSLKEVGFSGLTNFLATDVLSKTEGSISGQTQIGSAAGKLGARGNLAFNGAKVNGVDIGYPINLDYDLATDIQAGLTQIAAATLKLGPTPIALTGSVNTAATPAQLDLNVESGDVSIAEVARLASAFGVAFAPGTDVKGRFSAKVQMRGPATTPSLSGTVAGRDLEISGANVPQAVEVKTVDLSLTPAEITSNEFEVRSGKTTVFTRFALKQYSSPSPVAAVSLRAPGATLPEIQSISKAYGVAGLDQIVGKGALDLDLNAAGPLTSIGSAQVLRALNGNLNLNFDTVRLSGFDLAHELASVGGFLKPGDSAKNFTDILRLAGHVTVKDGVAQTNDLQAVFDVGNMAAAGTADLASNSLNLRVSAVLSKAFSEKALGPLAGSVLTTALSNERGELVIPAIVTGTMDKPKFSPDLQSVVRLQRQRLLPNLDNPTAALSDLLRSSPKKPEGTDSQAPPPKPAESIKSILNDFLKKK